MSDNMRLRVRFEKTGAIRYIGHLDVMRFFQKCLRRAEIDVAFTGGFSPHMIMTFAQPLSVGLESHGEYMDIEVHSVTDSQDMLERMNAASVPEIKIVSVKRLPENAGNAMASVAAAKYLVSFREGRTPALFKEDPARVNEAISEFLSKETIPYVKEGKKGTREVDLRPGILEFFVKEDRSLEMLLEASSGDNVKPAQVLEALLALHDDSLSENALQITRIDTYTRKETEDGSLGELLSMDEVGEIF